MSPPTSLPTATPSVEGQVSPVLELSDVTKVYGSHPAVVALRSVSLRVSRGELVAIVGPSGSGKSTLLHIIGTLDRPTFGSVSIDGFNVSRLSDEELSAIRATRIGFVFQQFFLAEHATLLDNVADGLLYTGRNITDRRDHSARALGLVGLGGRLSARPTQLSGGQRQRVAIARALVGAPSIVLADEPTGNLDSSTGESILRLLEQLNADGATMAVITHDHTIADRMPRQIELLDGRIVRDSGSLNNLDTPLSSEHAPA